MATITLTFDSKNIAAQNIIDVVLATGLFKRNENQSAKKQMKMRFEKSVADVKTKNYQDYESLNDFLSEL